MSPVRENFVLTEESSLLFHCSSTLIFDALICFINDSMILPQLCIVRSEHVCFWWNADMMTLDWGKISTGGVVGLLLPVFLLLPLSSPQLLQLYHVCCYVTYKEEFVTLKSKDSSNCFHLISYCFSLRGQYMSKSLPSQIIFGIFQTEDITVKSAFNVTFTLIL